MSWISRSSGLTRSNFIRGRWRWRACCGGSANCSPRAREKGLEIAWAVPRHLGFIDADEGRLRQILLNFAGNAVKFTQSGGVLLSVESAPSNRIRFTVADTGPGVSPTQRDRIFEAFAQANASDADLGGAGLGLAIVRRLAQAMDGDVGVDDRPAAGAAQGALFWFEAAFRVLPIDATPASLAGRMVGVASPNSVIREAARWQVEASGGAVLAAPTTEAVMDATAAGDVVLLDHALAEGTRLLRRPPDRRAIVLLAPDERGLIGRYRRAGFAGYLIKPLRRASLAERVLIAAGAALPPGGDLDDERVVAAPAAGKRVLLVEDNPINALLARALLSREGCSIDHAVRGDEALGAVRTGAYDLILMDMRMPGLSGVETASQMRAMGIQTPIVALTANAFEDDRHACLAAGMDDFLVKPMSPDSLRVMLNRWVGVHTAEPAAPAKVAATGR